MNPHEEFFAWLRNNSNLSTSTISKYTSAINTISNELRTRDLIEGNLYYVNDPKILEEIIDTYFSVPEHKEKDDRGNRMYSNALKYYSLFLRDLNKLEEQYSTTNLQKYKKKVIELTIKDSSTTPYIIDGIQPKPNFKEKDNMKYWSRNPKLASDTVIISNYSCEINKDHRHFISKFTNKNYVEAHHIIPMKYQEEFTSSLDVYANLVSLCLICHKKLHFGNFQEKVPILDKLYELRNKRMIKCGLNISLSDLYRFYQD
jgi:5-methylcytosine-specific restriction protein A